MKKISLTLALCLAMTACGKTDQRADQKDAPGATSASPAGSTPSGSAPTTAADMGGEPVERPEPTAAQTAALTGGQTVNWDQQGITWTLPANWKKQNVETKMLTYGGGDGTVLIVNISTMDESFPTDISTKAYYDGTKTRKKNGEVDELRYLEIDGVKGVQFRESPEKPDDFKRLQWLAYRKFAGQTQLVNLMLSTSNKNFAKHQDEFYAILYSTKLVH
jgi:ABC-type Fe3+-hydroxamate transport system substrate-binding protein